MDESRLFGKLSFANRRFLLDFRIAFLLNQTTDCFIFCSTAHWAAQRRVCAAFLWKGGVLG